MTDAPADNSPRIRWWVLLLPDIFVVIPLVAGLFGGAGAVFLLRDHRVIGLLALLAWLAYLAGGVRFLSRRRYTSRGFALAVALIGLGIAFGFGFLVFS